MRNVVFWYPAVFLETAALHSKEVRSEIRKAAKETCSGKNNISVTFQSVRTELPITFIDLTKNERFTEPLPTFDALQLKAELVRKRPKAYILPDTCRMQAEKLRALGIEVEEIGKPFTATVEKYMVTGYKKATKEWEKIYPVTVSTRMIKRKEELPGRLFHHSSFTEECEPCGNALRTGVREWLCQFRGGSYGVGGKNYRYTGEISDSHLIHYVSDELILFGRVMS